MGLFDWLRKKNGLEPEQTPPLQIGGKQESSTPAPSQSESGDDSVEIIPVSTNIDGFSVGKAILLDWCNGRDISTVLPGYFNTNYGINPVRTREELIREGYLTDGRPTDALEHMTGAKLKLILKSNGLKQSGKKSELVSRISSELDENLYQGDVPSVYVATAKGNSIIEKTGILTWAHKNFNKYGLGPNDLVSLLPSSGMSTRDYLNAIVPLQVKEIDNRLDQRSIQWAATLGGMAASAIADAGNPQEDWLPFRLFSLLTEYTDVGLYSEYDKRYVIWIGTSSQIGWEQAQAQNVFQTGSITDASIKQAVQEIPSKWKTALPYSLSAVWDEASSILNSLIFDSPEDAGAKRAHFIKSNVPHDALQD